LTVRSTAVLSATQAQYATFAGARRPDDEVISAPRVAGSRPVMPILTSPIFVALTVIVHHGFEENGHF
jgi:hypothetical protein